MVKIRIGITGAGAHASLLASAVVACGAEIVAVHDVSPKAADRLATLHKTEVATANLEELFAVPMDGLIVATPPRVRIEPIERACERRIHLFVQKPPAINLAEGKRCLAAMEGAGVIGAVGFMLRYDPLFERLRELVRHQEVHLVRSVMAHDFYLDAKLREKAPGGSGSYTWPLWYMQKAVSGGPIIHDSIHVLDCVRFVLGEPQASSALAIGVKNMSTLGSVELDGENALQVAYELENGAIGVHTYHAGHQRGSWEVELIGPFLRLTAERYARTIRGFCNGTEIDEVLPQADVTLAKVSAWVQAIATGDPTLVRASFRGGIRTLALADAAVRSQTSGRRERVEA